MYSVFTNVGRVKPHLPTKRTAQSDHERAAKSDIYEKTKRSRSFVEAWGKEFPSVVDGKDGMVCTPCMTYFGSCLKDDRASPFQTGCQNYKKESLSRHAKSQVHLKAVARAAADSAKPGPSQGDIALKMLSKSIQTKMRMLFRNAHAIAKNRHVIGENKNQWQNVSKINNVQQCDTRRDRGRFF